MQTWDETWEDLADRIAEAVAQVSSDMFLVLEYSDQSAGDMEPYAQMAGTGADPLCEVVSAWNLPAHDWPLNELALQRGGWSPPARQDFPNWWRFDLSEPDEIARGLLEGMRDGRDCTDPHGFRWRIGYFPTDPGGGEEIPEGATVLAFEALAA